ncbi:SDR family NAD(P)-dependent oxidoreductase [Mycobacterium sp. NPDC006124]|uniref:SDR family oxidoreductase n=1 Tax=Mycobacterium sp. NPDC006124 TaxID=3156729 RepID=UPI0033AF768E
MQWTGHTILITGGGSGIGAGLAAAMHHAGNQVVIAGRRTEVLQAMAHRHPGMSYLRFDQGDPRAVRAFADEVVRRHPQLSVLINNAGIVRAEDLYAPDPDVVAEVASTNLGGPLALTAHLLPVLTRRPSAAIVNVTSALAFVPKAELPTYCATKAALHSYTESLRFQLRHSSVHVIEVAPPRVRIESDAPGGDHGITVDEFVAEVMSSLVAHPEAGEIVVRAARRLRFAERRGAYSQSFNAVNDAKGLS